MNTDNFSKPPVSPIAWLQAWIADARTTTLSEPTAMSLATATADGRPSSRIVLFKGMDGDAPCFYTNTTSRKGEQLAHNSAAALCFWWDPLMRQVRIEGRCVALTPAQSDAYFAGRPRGSQLGAWASAQSQPIADRNDMERTYQQVEQRFQDQPVIRPPHWGGFKLNIERIEFWQGRDNRFHDRMVYTRTTEGGWATQRLQP